MSKPRMQFNLEADVKELLKPYTPKASSDAKLSFSSSQGKKKKGGKKKMGKTNKVSAGRKCH